MISANSTESRTAEWPVRVYYEDTDTAGVVYYANYLKFCERARTEWLRAGGFQQQALLDERQLGFVVRRVNCEFMAPARLDDELIVRSHIAQLRGASLQFVQDIYRQDEWLFRAEVEIVCMNTARQRPGAIPADIRAAFAAA